MIKGHRDVPLGAVVGVDLTGDAVEAGRAGAGEAVDAVGAVGPVVAGVAVALVDVLLAAAPAEPRHAGAHKGVGPVPAQTAVTAGV